VYQVSNNSYKNLEDRMNRSMLQIFI